MRIHLCLSLLFLSKVLCTNDETSLRDIIINIIQQIDHDEINRLQPETQSDNHKAVTTKHPVNTASGSGSSDDVAEKIIVIEKTIKEINKEIIYLESAFFIAMKYIGPNKKIYEEIVRIESNPEIPENEKKQLVGKLKSLIQVIDLDPDDKEIETDGQNEKGPYEKLVFVMDKAAAKLVRIRGKVAAALKEMQEEKRKEFKEFSLHFVNLDADSTTTRKKEAEVKYQLEDDSTDDEEKIDGKLAKNKNVDRDENKLETELLAGTEVAREERGRNTDDLELDSLETELEDQTTPSKEQRNHVRKLGLERSPNANKLTQADVTDLNENNNGLLDGREWHDKFCTRFGQSCGGWKPLCCAVGTLNNGQTFPMCCRFIALPDDRLSRLLLGNQPIKEGICLPNPYGNSPCVQ